MRVLSMVVAVILAVVVNDHSHAQSDLQKAQNLATCLAGRYPTLCRHAWLNPEEKSKVEAAEKRENLRTCLIGRYPTLCKRNKLTPEELGQVVAAEKRENLKTCMAGRYRTLCKKNLLTESELKEVLAAERRENLKICMAGTYPTLCVRSLLTQDQVAQVQVAEKKATESRRQTIARAGPRPGRRSGGMGCEDGHWVESVSSDGTIVKLEDGSVWEVDAVDAIDSALWLPVTDIIACDDKLINTDDNESVSARRIR